MSKENMHHLIDELGQKLGLPDMQMDDNDFVCIFTDDGVVLNLDYHEDENILVIYTTVGEIADDKRLQLYEEMLRGNFVWQSTAGATMCIDPSAKLAMMMANVTVGDLDLPKLLNVLNHFTRLAWVWSDRIRELSGHEAPAQQPQHSAPPDMFDPTRMA